MLRVLASKPGGKSITCDAERAHAEPGADPAEAPAEDRLELLEPLHRDVSHDRPLLPRVRSDRLSGPPLPPMEHGGTLNRPAQIVERLVGPLQRVLGDLVRTGTSGASAMNSSPSRAGQVGHRPQRALAPEDLVGERGDVAHVDPGADHRPAGSHGAEGGRDELPDGAKMIAASSGSGSPLAGIGDLDPPSVSPAHAAPSSSANRCVSARRRAG